MHDDARHRQHSTPAQRHLPQPPRNPGEQQRRCDEREERVLQHVRAQQIVLADIVHRSAGGEIDYQHARREPRHLRPPHAPRVGHRRPQLRHGVQVRSLEEDAEQHDVSMKMPVPPVGRRSGVEEKHDRRPWNEPYAEESMRSV